MGNEKIENTPPGHKGLSPEFVGRGKRHENLSREENHKKKKGTQNKKRNVVGIRGKSTKLFSAKRGFVC